LLARLTTAPPLGAEEERVTVHVALELDVREDGEQASVEGAGRAAAAARLIGDVAVDPFSDAVTMAD